MHSCTVWRAGFMPRGASRRGEGHLSCCRNAPHSGASSFWGLGCEVYRGTSLILQGYLADTVLKGERVQGAEHRCHGCRVSAPPGFSIGGSQGYLVHKNPPPPQDPTVGLCLGPCGGPREAGFSDERGTPVEGSGRGASRPWVHSEWYRCIFSSAAVQFVVQVFG